MGDALSHDLRPSKSTAPAARRSEAIDVRSLTLRVLNLWLNVTLLYLLAWPLLNVVFDAPQETVAELPLGWFIVYLAPALAVLVLATRLWRVNQLPSEVVQPTRALALLKFGGWRGQAVLFLVGLTLVTSVMLLLAAPADGAKVLINGLIRAAALQVLISGYVKTMLDQLGADPRRTYWFGVGMFAFTFAADTAVQAAVRQNASLDMLPIAFAAGTLLGLLLGLASLSLRDRTGSLAPALLLQLLMLTILPAFFDS
jgi:hypothetical protein